MNTGMTILTGFFLFMLFDRAASYVASKRWIEPKRLGEWKAPRGCKAFDHKWEDTKYHAPSFPLPFLVQVERCARCRVGRLGGITGYSYRTPADLDAEILKKTAVDEGKVATLDPTRRRASPPVSPVGL